VSVIELLQAASRFPTGSTEARLLAILVSNEAASSQAAITII